MFREDVIKDVPAAEAEAAAATMATKLASEESKSRRLEGLLRSALDELDTLRGQRASQPTLGGLMAPGGTGSPALPADDVDGADDESRGMDIRWEFSIKSKEATITSPVFLIGDLSFSIQFTTAHIQHGDVTLAVLCHLPQASVVYDWNAHGYSEMMTEWGTAICFIMISLASNSPHARPTCTRARSMCCAAKRTEST